MRLRTIGIATAVSLLLAGLAAAQRGDETGKSCSVRPAPGGTVVITYPPGARVECERLFKALAALRDQQAERGWSELELFRRMKALLDSPDARAVLAVSNEPGTIGQAKAYAEKRLRELQAK